MPIGKTNTKVDGETLDTIPVLVGGTRDMELKTNGFEVESEKETIIREAAEEIYQDVSKAHFDDIDALSDVDPSTKFKYVKLNSSFTKFKYDLKIESDQVRDLRWWPLHLLKLVQDETDLIKRWGKKRLFSYFFYNGHNCDRNKYIHWRKTWFGEAYEYALYHLFKQLTPSWFSISDYTIYQLFQTPDIFYEYGSLEPYEIKDVVHMVGCNSCRPSRRNQISVRKKKW